jgi:TRAP-type mannitol/chloroaromatic compound transport system permease large subunit
MGIATPTEASGVGALGASLLAIIRGRLSFSDLKIVIRKTTHTTAYIFALFVGATMFALILRGLGGDELIEGALKGITFWNKWSCNSCFVCCVFVRFLFRLD